MIRTAVFSTRLWRVSSAKISSIISNGSKCNFSSTIPVFASQSSCDNPPKNTCDIPPKNLPESPKKAPDSTITSAGSLARSNFHTESERALNRQINHELFAHYSYLAMAVYFDRDDVALPGFASYFFDKSLEERGHAILCAKYLNKRGGRVKLESINVPQKLEWKSGLEAMEEALEMEKSVNETLIHLHKIGSEHGDPQLTTFVEDNFFQEQTEDIKTLANYVGILRKVGKGLGEFEFDFEVLRKQGEVKKFAAAQEKKSPNSPAPSP